MKMEQMMECLIAAIGGLEVGATIKEMRASQEHLKEEMLAKVETKIDANQE
jgi:hypothetical protein